MNRTGLKYYLRALGIGIVVAALLMGYSQKGQARMTDEEIRQRAAQLGMTEPQGVLSELATPSPEESPGAALTASPTPQPTEEPAAGRTHWSTAGTAASPTPQPTEDPMVSPTPQPTEEPASSPTPQPTEEPVASPTPQPTEEPASSPTPQSTATPTASPVPAEDTAILVISRGESSVTVSKNLEELGLVEDYWTFDRYLCENGYDHSIGTGTYQIPIGTTEEEIARIICNLR